MKLYATTTSERASKGQGGNEYILIDVMNEKKDKIIQFHITQAKDHLRGEHQNIYIYNPNAEYVDISQNDFIEPKGKRQKGELTSEDIFPSSDRSHLSRWRASGLM